MKIENYLTVLSDYVGLYLYAARKCVCALKVH